MFWAVIIGLIAAFGFLMGLTFWFGKSSPISAPDGTQYSAAIVESTNASTRKLGKWMTIVFACVLACVYGWYKLSYSSAERIAEREAKDLEKKCSDASMAYVMSQNFVKSRLKAPSSADFPLGVSQFSKAIGDCKFAISSYVDSQNSFGAMIRTRYTATMEYLPKENSWRAVALDIE